MFSYCRSVVDHLFYASRASDGNVYVYLCVVAEIMHEICVLTFFDVQTLRLLRNSDCLLKRRRVVVVKVIIDRFAILYIRILGKIFVFVFSNTFFRIRVKNLKLKSKDNTTTFTYNNDNITIVNKIQLQTSVIT